MCCFFRFRILKFATHKSFLPQNSSSIFSTFRVPEPYYPCISSNPQIKFLTWPLKSPSPKIISALLLDTTYKPCHHKIVISLKVTFHFVDVNYGQSQHLFLKCYLHPIILSFLRTFTTLLHSTSFTSIQTSSVPESFSAHHNLYLLSFTPRNHVVIFITFNRFRLEK